MAVKPYAKHVPALALKPVCHRPERTDGINSRVCLRQGHLYSYPLFILQGIKMINYLETRLFLSEIINRSQVHKEIIREFRHFFQKAAYLNYVHPLDHCRVVTPERVGLYNGVKEPFLKFFKGDAFHPQISCFWFCIFSCSFIMPSSTVSGLGGHPGMYTSTGTMVSIPCTVA